MDASSYVVVALPSERDPVNKYSSEKKPHLTLLYLDGSTFDDAQFELVAQQVQFASTLLSPFMMHVKDRGTLGDKNADVLFFEKTWSANIARFRDNLLRNDLIMASYLAADQFPQWSPHLTMGYPETPAPKDNREDPGFWYVNFDRIALWTGESEGPEFKLEHPDYDSLEVAMSQLARGRSAVDDVLSHYGVKGMHWGTRKSEDSGGSPSRADKKIAKLDKKFEKGAQASDITMAVYNGAADHMNRSAIPRINNKPKYRDKDLSEPSKLRDEYHREYEREFGKALDNAAKELGTNASGTRRYRVKVNDEDGSWDINTEAIKHEAPIFTVMPVYDDHGFVVSIELDEASLTHYGVKGMKWGVHKSESGSTSSEDARIFEKDTKRIQTHGTRSLSNKELQSVLNRMNMENQFHNLSASNRDLVDTGHQQVKKILKIGKTVEEARKFLDTPTGKAIKNGLFGAATVGAAYATGGASSAAAAGAQVAVRRASNHFTNTGN